MADPKSEPTEGAEDAPIPVMTFDYKRSPLYRTVHVNGAFGGRSIRGEVFAMVFSERMAHPTQCAYRVDGQKLAEEIHELRKGSDNTVREIEACLIMSAEAAESLGNWLLDHAKRARAKEPVTVRAQPSPMSPNA